VGRENDVGAAGNFCNLIDKHHPASFQLADHVNVVHDLLAHINRSTETIQRFLHGNHRAIYSRTIPTRGSQQNLLLCCDSVVNKFGEASRDKRGLEKGCTAAITNTHAPESKRLWPDIG
jgi:hypothetical protein